MSIPWEKTAMEIAGIYAERSHCKWFKVGAVFFVGDRIVAAGYNGPPRGEAHCDEVGCAKERNGKRLPSGSGLCRGAHAEMNAIANAARVGVSLRGAWLACTIFPCWECAKVLVNVGVSHVLFEKTYSDDDNRRTMEMFRRAGISFSQYLKGEKNET